MSLKNFIFSKVFFKHLGLATAIFVGILLILMLWMNIYTRHGQERAVGSFIGMTVEEAQKLGEELHLLRGYSPEILLLEGSLLTWPGTRISKALEVLQGLFSDSVT